MKLANAAAVRRRRLSGRRRREDSAVGKSSRFTKSSSGSGPSTCDGVERMRNCSPAGDRAAPGLRIRSHSVEEARESVVGTPGSRVTVAQHQRAVQVAMYQFFSGAGSAGDTRAQPMSAYVMRSG